MNKKISFCLFGILLVSVFTDGLNGIKYAIIFLAYMHLVAKTLD